MGVSAQSDTTYDLHSQVFSGLESRNLGCPSTPQILSELETKPFQSNDLLLLLSPPAPTYMPLDPSRFSELPPSFDKFFLALKAMSQLTLTEIVSLDSVSVFIAQRKKEEESKAI